MRDLLDQMPVRTLKVGHFVYSYEKMSEREAAAGEEEGSTNFEDLTILIRANLKPQKTLNVLIHETLHAMNSFFDLTDKNTEEEFCERGANGLVMIWQDNPELFDWFNKQMKVYCGKS